MGSEVRKITHEEMTEAQGTPGLLRSTAFETEGHWFGHVEAAPRTMSGWHHHGENTTVGYVLKGSIAFEFGVDGSESINVHEGEFFEVPRGVIHREGNASDSVGEVVIARFGHGQLVYPVEGPASRA